MNQIAVFIDAGYFWVQAGHVVHGARKVRREDVSIDYAALRKEVLDQVAAQFPRADLLRVYWYDGPGAQGSKMPTHHAIDELDDFKLRLGTRNGYGDQKAVDGLIIADLIGLAQSKAITGAVLLSGDADLTPGVITAQGLGIRVHLLSMGPATATSPYLRADVDYKAYWADPTVQKFATASVATAPMWLQLLRSLLTVVQAHRQRLMFTRRSRSKPCRRSVILPTRSCWKMAPFPRPQMASCSGRESSISAGI